MGFCAKSSWSVRGSRWIIISGNKPKSSLTPTKIKILNIALGLTILPKNVPNYTFAICLVKKIASVEIFDANIDGEGQALIPDIFVHLERGSNLMVNVPQR